MPSNKDPAAVVNPGPGRLPAGSVPAGALIPPGGGGGAGAFVALEAHINNPFNAHMAHAIGVDPYYPPGVGPTPDPILTSVGGPVDGEDVLDFIDEFKDLIPPHPNYLGFYNAVNITDGIPSWGTLDPAGVGTGVGTAEGGGYASGTNVVWSHWLVPTTSSTFAISGILFPADRGIVALYKNTNGNFLDPTHTTLVAALFLGDITPFPPPAGVPFSTFNENLRRTQQVNYTASGVGLDQISLTTRYPYLKDYTGYTLISLTGTMGVTNGLTTVSTTLSQVGIVMPGMIVVFASQPSVEYTVMTVTASVITLTTMYTGTTAAATSTSLWPYGPFPTNFFRFQLAKFSVNAQAVAVGDAQDWLLVHWRETYAVSLASIQPSNLTLPNLTITNCYSGVPTSNTSYGAGSWDDNTGAAFNVNRHFVFLDSNSAGFPVATFFTTAPVGTVTTTFLSGVKYYNSTGLEMNVDIRATGLFANSFQTGSVDSPPNVPAQFHSAFDPIQMNFVEFGAGILPVPYYVMNKFGFVPLYSSTNSPAPADTGEYQNATMAIASPVAFCPLGGFAQIQADLWTPFHEVVVTDVKEYLYDSLTPGSVSTTTFEPFVDELYRYSFAFDPTSSSLVSVVPSGGNIFISSAVLTGGGGNLQVVGQAVVYPGTTSYPGNPPPGFAGDYNVGTIVPSQTPDYSSFPGGDGVDHFRRLQRAVDTGTARNTGWIRLRGLTQAAFTANAAYDGAEKTGHTTGGAIIEIKIPGASGSDWLDIGRQYGDPGIVGPLGTSPFYGCSTGVISSGSDIYVSFNMGANFTSNNGTGNFLLFVRVTFINGAVPHGLVLDQFQWYPPTFVPP